jgi:hypothetical protein
MGEFIRHLDGSGYGAPPDRPPPPEGIADYPEFEELDPIQLVRRGIPTAQILGLVEDFFRGNWWARKKMRGASISGDPEAAENSLLYYLTPKSGIDYSQHRVLRFEADRYPSPDVSPVRFMLVDYTGSSYIPLGPSGELPSMRFVTIVASCGHIKKDTRAIVRAIEPALTNPDMIVWSKSDLEEVFIAVRRGVEPMSPLEDPALPDVLGIKLTRTTEGIVTGSVQLLVPKGTEAFRRLAGE